MFDSWQRVNTRIVESVARLSTDTVARATSFLNRTVIQGAPTKTNLRRANKHNADYGYI
jgi:hypothetical protein